MAVTESNEVRIPVQNVSQKASGMTWKSHLSRRVTGIPSRMPLENHLKFWRSCARVGVDSSRSAYEMHLEVSNGQ